MKENERLRNKADNSWAGWELHTQTCERRIIGGTCYTIPSPRCERGNALFDAAVQAEKNYHDHKFLLRGELISKLNELIDLQKDTDNCDWDKEHRTADEALLLFIDDEEISSIYRRILKYYS